MDQIGIEKRIIVLEQKVKELEAHLSPSSEPIGQAPKKMSIKEFLLSKKADNDVKRTLLIGYFFEKFDGFSSFNIKDIKKGYSNAKIPLPLNISDKININIRNGHIMENSEKKGSTKSWVLTASGEIFVESNLNLSK